MSEERSAYLCQTTAPAKGEASDAPSELLHPVALKDADLKRIADAIEAVLYEDSDKPDNQRLVDRVRAAALLADLKEYLLRRDEVAASAASDDAHPEQPKLDTIKTDFAEALEIIKGMEAHLGDADYRDHYGPHNMTFPDDPCHCPLCSARSFLQKHGGNHDAG